MRALSYAALAALILVHLLAVPLTLWEFDEPYFAMAVERFQPLQHHPPPPGYPLYIGFAQVLRPLFGDPFRTLVAISIAGTLLGVAAFAAAFGLLARSRAAGILGALLLYSSPALLVHATLPQSDSMAMALLGVSLFLSARAMDDRTIRSAALMALACAVTVGWRLQFSIAIVPLFLTTVVLIRNWRARIVTLAVFGLSCLAWLVPLVSATGGLGGFRKWIGGQAAYFAAHDADLSRSGSSAVEITFRFLAHPWGPKWLSLAVLLGAAIGLVRLRDQWLRAVPLLVMTAVYLAAALWTMDPADAVRYALPALPGVAFLAIAAMQTPAGSRLETAASLAVIAYAAGSCFYTGPVLRQRAAGASPPVAAIRHLRAVAPRNAVILYDLPLRPHAEYLLRGFRRTRIDDGLLRFGHRLDVPLFVLADGETAGTVFRWKSSDAYRKLTRNFYGVVTVTRVPDEERYQAVQAVYSPERSRDGKSWRWIGGEGVLALPDIGASQVRLTFRLPPEYPLDGNRVRVGDQAVELRRDQSASVVVPYAPSIRIAAERTFVPAAIAGSNNRDKRTLSVMLTKVEQIRPSAPAAAPASRASAP